MKLFTLFILLLSLKTLCFSQTDSTWQNTPNVEFSGFIDAYYAYDFNKPETTYRQAFLFNHNRHNETNINLAYVKVAVDHTIYRANLALQAGTYAQDNYTAEEGMLKNLYEANVGISLNQKNNFWLDAGIFSSHLGFESATSINNPTLTRSLAAESSPYYLAGAKITFTPNEKWEMAALICNGWQRIQRVQGNSLPGLGTQLVFKPNANTTLNWSTFVGTDDPDSTRRMRYFNDIYGQFQITKKLGFIAGFDFGFQQKTKRSSKYDSWLVPTLIAYYSINNQWKTALRAEYFQDENGVIISTGKVNGFKNVGLSANIDYLPVPNIACRLEGRVFQSKDAIYIRNGDSNVNSDAFITASIAVKIN